LPIYTYLVEHPQGVFVSSPQPAASAPIVRPSVRVRGGIKVQARPAILRLLPT
jgi:hypothetical protein